MKEDELFDQAAELETLFPHLARRLFAVNPDDPALELPITQLRVCSILQSGPATMTVLGDELAISLSAVTQIADRLERAGMVERIADAEDRRMKKLVLTPHGVSVMRARWERRVRHCSGALQGLPQARRAEVLSALRDLLTASSSLRGGSPPSAGNASGKHI